MYLELFEKCLHGNYIHTKEDGDYCIQICNRTCYLMFQWSVGKEDWKNNFDFPAKAYKNGNETWFVHRGFLKVWKAMRDDIEEIVKGNIENNEIDNIVCIGYSHGAAICTFAVEDMEYLFGNKVHVSGYAYACPRVIWGKVPTAVRQRLANLIKIKNRGDIVTHVPPMLFGFRNVGNELLIGKCGKYKPVQAHLENSYRTELKIREKGE